MDSDITFFIRKISTSDETKNGRLTYSLIHKKDTFGEHSFNDDYLSIPERPGTFFMKSPVLTYFIVTISDVDVFRVGFTRMSCMK